MTKTLDFAQIEALRKHMLLTVGSMCDLFKVSRVAWYNWVKGSKPRKVKSDEIRRLVRGLVTLVSQDKWPNAAVYQATQAERLTMLKEALENLDKDPVNT